MKTYNMDHGGGNHPILAAFSSLLSLASASFAVITVQSVQPFFTLFGSLIAMVSGFFAIRYYYYATKKIK